ncbi:hypothetical protein L596_006874 [Steinernema carpocapsae]|uniref:Uncharacterized protein n=1 Tax=Steinernema carpocapsae TaxID=34508 RepID=A0A4U5P788_STECR|nr:hypothetical protein L596_006874 [Steinernema carpocapsae]
MSRRVDQHIAVQRFIAHRHRVLDMKPMVDSRRSKSVPPPTAAARNAEENSRERRPPTTQLPRKTPLQTQF